MPVAGPAEGPCGKGSFEGTGTPKGSNGEQGEIGKPKSGWGTPEFPEIRSVLHEFSWPCEKRCNRRLARLDHQ